MTNYNFKYTTMGFLMKNLEKESHFRVREIRRTRRTCPAKFGNVRRRAVVEFNQMSGEKLEMSGEAQNNFAYSGHLN